MREDWEEVELIKVCFKAQKVKRKEMSPYGTLKYLDIGGIDNASNTIVSHKDFTWENAPSRAQQIVKKGDVLFSTVRTYLKNIAQVKVNEYDNEICSSGFTVLRGNPAILNSSYLFYLSLSVRFLNPLSKLQTGTSYPAVRDKDVFAQNIPLAPLPEQRAIVAKIEELFSDLDKGIADLKKAQDQLKVYRQAVLKKAFENLTNETTLEEIKKDSLIGLVRASGLQNNIGEGTAYLKMDKIDMIGNINIEGLVYVETNEDEIEKYSLKTGDILLNTRNSYELVGKTGVIRNIKETVVFNNNIMRIRVKNGFDSLFVCYQLISPFVRKQMEEYKKATTSVCALYQRNLFPLKLKTTSLEEQHQIVQEIESRLSVCDKVEQSITESLIKAKSLRQSILKKAFEGTLLSVAEIAACKAAPDYEPASVLLARIERSRKEKIKAEKKR